MILDMYAIVLATDGTVICAIVASLCRYLFRVPPPACRDALAPPPRLISLPAPLSSGGRLLVHLANPETSTVALRFLRWCRRWHLRRSQW